MPGTPSRMNQTAREQILSNDLNRIGNLAGRELMDRASARSVRADFYNPATGTFDDFTAGGKSAQAVPLSGASVPPSLDGIAGQFAMSLGHGQCELPGVASSADVSTYQLLRWDAQTVAWPPAGAPDPTNPKICLIVATPADANVDLESRNILLDPVTRAVSPQNCWKTSNPVAAISVVVGMAAAAPLAPPVPAGAMALLEVYIPALAVDSTAFQPTRRAGTSQHGILKGCVPTISGAGIFLPSNKTNRLVMDGELITFQAAASLRIVTADSAHPPSAAPAGNDKPFYLYLCGGRTAPFSSTTVSGGYRVPVVGVLSSLAPDQFGYPTAALSITYGGGAVTFPQSACLYIGIGFYAAGSSTPVASIYDDDWIRSLQTVTNGTLRFKGFKQADLANLAATYTAFPLAGIPATATAMELRLGFVEAATQNVLFSDDGGDTGVFARLSTVAASNIYDTESLILSAASSIYYKADVSIAHTNSAMIMAAAWNMNIPRIGR